MAFSLFFLKFTRREQGVEERDRENRRDRLLCVCVCVHVRVCAEGLMELSAHVVLSDRTPGLSSLMKPTEELQILFTFKDQIVQNHNTVRPHYLYIYI